MIQFQCDRCGGTIQVSPESAGLEATCPSCGAFITVPTTVAATQGVDLLPPPPPGGAPLAPGQRGPGEQLGKGMAVTALVLGLCGLIPVLGIVLGLVGAILGIVALAKRRPGKGLATAGVVCGFAFGLLVQFVSLSILLPSLGRARELSRQSACMMSLNSLGRGMMMYEQNQSMLTGGEGAWPPDFDALIDEKLATRNMLKCPSDDSGHEVSYVYAPPDPGPSDDTIVACCRPGIHADGVIVLYANGRVKGPIAYADFWFLLAQPENVRMAEELAELGITEQSSFGSD